MHSLIIQKNSQQHPRRHLEPGVAQRLLDRGGLQRVEERAQLRVGLRGAGDPARWLLRRVNSRINFRVNIRVNFRLILRMVVRKIPKKKSFSKKIRPNGVDFLNPQVEKPLTTIFEPNWS